MKKKDSCFFCLNVNNEDPSLCKSCVKSSNLKPHKRNIGLFVGRVGLDFVKTKLSK